MKKLYIYNEKQKCYYYDEAWVADGEIIEHIGRLGTRGRTKSNPIDSSLSEEENVLKVLAPALRGGYKEIQPDDHRILIIQYSVEGFGAPEDLDKRYALQDRMDETLGWTGLGHCDGGSIGSDSMEVCCLVVDFNLAKKVIEKDLKRTEFADYTRIYDEGA
jgi:hypothetical protein